MLFSIICCLVTITIGYKSRYKFPELKFLYLYPLASFIQLIIAFCLDATGSDIRSIFERISTNIFLLIEFVLIFNFFWKILKLRLTKNIMTVIAGFYFITLSIFWGLLKGILTFPTNFFLIQAFCIIILGYSYFYELFKTPLASNLLNEPPFWVVIGLVSYFECTLPLFFMKDFIIDKMGIIRELDLYAINFFCYGIMFMLITKAYLCKPRGVK